MKILWFGAFKLLTLDNFDFTRKIVKKNLVEKLVKMLGYYQNVIFGQKFDFPNSVYFDEKLVLFYSKPQRNLFENYSYSIRNDF